MCMSSSMTSTQQIVQRRRLLLPEALLVFHCDKRSHLCISGLLISRLQLSGCHQAAWRSGGEGRVPLCPSCVGGSSRNLWHCSSAAASAPEEPPGSSSNSWRILLESCIFWSPALHLCFILLQSASPQHFQAPHALLHVKDLHISLVLGISCHLLKTPLLWDWVPLDLCPEQRSGASAAQSGETEFLHCFSFLILREKPLERACQSLLWNLTYSLKIAFRWELRASTVSWLEEQKLADPHWSTFPKLIFHIKSPLPFPCAV